MKHDYWLLLGVAAVGATQAAACSSNFDSCKESRTCASTSTGDAGEAPVGGGAGNSGGPSVVAVGGGGGGADNVGGAPSAPGSDAGAAGTSSAEPILFGACSVVGELACQESASAQRLACDGKKWQAGTTCADGELCDSGTGACAKVVAECAAAKPGKKVCRADKVLTCGADLVTADESPACEGTCKDGVCQAPKCGDHKVETGEDCDDDALAASGACVKCKGSTTCGDGVLYVGHEQCDDGNHTAGDGCSPTCFAEPVALALGLSTSCALSSTGIVKCWGANAYGQLGLGDKMNRGDMTGQLGDRLDAVALGTGRTAKAISASYFSSCALLDNGDVKCWGLNDSGQLGTGDKNARGDSSGEMGDALKAIPLGGRATAVSIGGGHACAVLDTGTLKCWGSGAAGQLGQGDSKDQLFVDKLLPIDLGANESAKAVSASQQYTTCALLNDGNAKCWGTSQGGGLSGGILADLGSDPHSDIPAIGDAPREMAALPPLNFGTGHTVKSIVAATAMGCALLDDDTVKCWGENYEGKLGQGISASDQQALGQTSATLAALPPVNVGTGHKVKSISAENESVCALLDDGSVKCWGVNEYGQLGIGSTDYIGADPADMGDKLKAVPLGRRAHQIAVGPYHACAILDNGSVMCWGANEAGELGVGDITRRGDTGGLAGVVLKPVDLSF